MKVRIAKTFDFDAAHWLPNVNAEHKCSRLHGHTYRVEVICEGVPDKRGMVIDYGEIAEAWKGVDALLDHRLLNDVEGLSNPTTEILAPWIHARLMAARWAQPITGDHVVAHVLKAVRVYESSTTYCEYPTTTP